MGLISGIYNSTISRHNVNGKKKKKKYVKGKGARVITYKPETFYESEVWLRLRYAVLQRYGAKCMVCGRDRSDNIKIHIDHIKPRSKYPELALSMDNLQVLCHECNIGKSNLDETDWRPKQKTGPKIPAR